MNVSICLKIGQLIMNNEILKKIMEASSQIHRYATRGSANYITVSASLDSYIKHISRRERCQRILQNIKEWKSNSNTI